MKLNLFLILTLTYTTIQFAQSKEEIEVKDFFWGTNDTYKNAIDIPEKWSNESAVIIYKNENYDFHKFGKNVTYITSVRKRIKLLDKASVEEFSEFSYKKRFSSNKGYSFGSKGKNIIGVKVIKPNGSEIIIDIEKEAVVVDGETKVAIANLEVGDIIDYYFYRKEPFKSSYAFGFEPVERTLREEYPTMEYKLFFETENDFFINFNSYNGAPELTNTPTEKSSIRRYEMIAENVDRYSSERWVYPLVERPSYKFQVYFARSGKFEKRAEAFLPKKEEQIKKNVTSEEVLELYDYIYPYGDLRDVERFLKGKSYDSDTEKVTAIYYYMRHYHLTRYLEAFLIKEAGIIDTPFGVYSDNSMFFNNETTFIKYFLAVLKDNKIKYDLLLSQKRYDGSLDDLLIKKNLNAVIKAKTNPPVYIKFFSPHSTVNQFTALLEGADAYALPVNKKWDFRQIEKTTIPNSSHVDNETKKEITLDLNEEFNSFILTSKVSYKGHEKEDEQFDRLIIKDYVVEDHKMFGTKSFTDLVRKAKRPRIKKELNAVYEKLLKKQEESFEEDAQSEYGIDEIEDYTYEIDETGRYHKNSPFSFTESFKTKDALIKKAGPNFIIEMGKLIGSQIDVSIEEKARLENIYMEYPRSYNYHIVFNIPEGYTISGLDNLNKSVDNSTGAFISTAKIVENQLIITTSKQYKHNYESKSNWNLMRDFLIEAHQFTNEKILLKKN